MSFLGWLVIGIFLICAVGVTDPKQDKESDERAKKAAAARERRAKIMQQMAAQQNTFMKVCLVLRIVRCRSISVTYLFLTPIHTRSS